MAAPAKREYQKDRAAERRPICMPLQTLQAIIALASAYLS